MAKDRTASNMSSSKKKKRARHLLSGPSAAALKSSKQSEKPNPFDSIWSRRKFDTLGKRRKGEERRVGQSRSLAIEKRRKTLQKEYEQSSKSSTFLDKRIGETDDTLPEYVKGLLRQQRERRLKFKRPSKYNLSDGEEDDSAIHQANSLSAMDDFDDEVPPDDDNDAFMGTETISSLELKTPNPWLHIHNDVQDVNPIDFFKMMDMPPESKFFDSDNFQTSVLVSVIETLKGFINIYEGLSSFFETFLPFFALIHQGLQNLKLPDLLRGKMVEVVDLIKKKASDHLTLRQPLQIRKQKPVPIRLLNPKFEEKVNTTIQAEKGQRGRN